MKEFETYIDKIIDVIHRNSSLKPVECFPVDEPYILLVCKGDQFHSKRDLQYWLDYVKYPDAYFHTSCDMEHEWLDTRDGHFRVPADIYDGKPPQEPDWWDEEEYGEFMPEDAFREGHGNNYGPWMLDKCLKVKLWFKIPEVGLPQKWDRNCDYIYNEKD